MKHLRRLGLRTFVAVPFLGLTLTTLTGCQTWFGGMTLPSPRYLEHPPQYFPQSPPFPLDREVAQIEATYAAPAPGAPVEILPAPVAPLR